MSSVETAVYIDDSQSDTTVSYDIEEMYDSQSDDGMEPDEIEVQEYIEQLQAARDALDQAQRRYNELAGLDENGDARMPDVPLPVEVNEAVDMDGAEPSAPQPESISLSGFFQVLGADGFYHHTRYIFTTTTIQAAQLFGPFIPLP